MGASWADMKAAHRNTRRSVRIPLDQAAVEEAGRLDDELPRIQRDDDELTRDPQAPLTAERIRDLERQAAASEVLFVFEGIGRARHAKLLAEHQASDEQKKLLGEYLPYNPEAFPPALLAASCVEPAELRDNVDEWRAIHDTWSAGQVKALWSTCTDANGDVMETPKSARASAVLARRNSAPS